MPFTGDAMALYRPGIVFVGMETSGAIRRRMQARGFETYSCDLLPSEDGGEAEVYSDDGIPLGRHLVGDVFSELENLRANDMWPAAAVFHPDCTYLTGSAEWAFGDGPYHQRVKAGTLTGASRREAREAALVTVQRIFALPIGVKVVENPVGAISTRIRKPTQTVQPWEFGDDASKKTCLWLLDKNGSELPLVPKRPDLVRRGRMVQHNGKLVERWGNQTDSGQNRLSPGADRWKDRSRTYDGIAEALATYLEAALDPWN